MVAVQMQHPALGEAIADRAATPRASPEMSQQTADFRDMFATDTLRETLRAFLIFTVLVLFMPGAWRRS